jgi:cellulose synthase operon protein C
MNCRFLIVIAFLLPIFLLSQTVTAQWLKNRESPDELYKKAKRDIEQTKYQKAINECRDALDQTPKNLDTRLLLGRAYALQGKIDSARIELNFVLDKNPRYRDAYLYLIMMEFFACNYQQALEYADMGLKYFPLDREILLKKLEIYEKEADWIEGNKLADYLFDHYPSDPEIRKVYIEYKLNIARHNNHQGYVDIAIRNYEAVLEQDPTNKEAMEAIFNLDIKSGNYQKSLESVNRGLLANPNSFEYLRKKIAILEAMYRYLDAVEIVEKLVKLYPNNAEVRRLNVSVRMDAGIYFMRSDPLIQFGSVLETEPTNADALSYIINVAYSRGLLPEALEYVNLALKKAPTNKDLLAKKLNILETMGNYGQAGKIAETLYRQKTTQENKDHMLELKNEAVRTYMADQEYDSAVAVLNTILAYEPSNVQAISYLANVYIAQKNYDEALAVLDKALKSRPNEEQLLFKKASVLYEYQRYPEAADISRQLIRRFPKNKYYISAFIDQVLAQGRASMQHDDYASTITILLQALEIQPNNIDALNYIINLEAGQKEYDSSIYYCDQAIKFYPDSKEFLVKKSNVYAEQNLFKEAYEISGDLYTKYPYNYKYRTLYVEHLIGSGKQYLLSGESDNALGEFNKALEVAPTDTYALYTTINLLLDRKDYDAALDLVIRGRVAYPTKPDFLIKEAQAYEGKKNYYSAYLSMDTLNKMISMDQKFKDYREILKSKELRNEFGVFFLHSTYDPQNIVANTADRNIATVQYTYRVPRWSIAIRMNYAGRVNGTGYQTELEATYNHTPHWTSDAYGGYSGQTFIFPKYRLGYTLSHGFNRGWDVEGGIRYVTTDSGTMTAFEGAISKEWRDFYFTLRGYSINMKTNTVTAGPFQSIALTSKYYLNEIRTNFFTVSYGYGTAPDDFSRLTEVSQKSFTYNTISVSAGCQFHLRYRSLLGLNYTWFNERITTNPDTYKGQYDLYIYLLHKF